MDQEKIKNWLGEFTLIVAGVLVALWVNAGWQGIQDRRSESVLLDDMKTDFTENLSRIDELLVWNEGAPDWNMKVLERGVGIIPDDSLFFYFLAVWMTPDLVPLMGALESALSSGSFHLIRDHELRHRMAAWSSTLASAQSGIMLASDLDRKMMSQSTESQMSLFYSQIEDLDLDVPLFQNLMVETFADPELRQIIALKSMYIKTNQPAIQKLRDETAQILELLH